MNTGNESQNTDDLEETKHTMTPNVSRSVTPSSDVFKDIQSYQSSLSSGNSTPISTSLNDEQEQESVNPNIFRAMKHIDYDETMSVDPNNDSKLSLRSASPENEASHLRIIHPDDLTPHSSNEQLNDPEISRVGDNNTSLDMSSPIDFDDNLTQTFKTSLIISHKEIAINALRQDILNFSKIDESLYKDLDVVKAAIDALSIPRDVALIFDLKMITYKLLEIILISNRHNDFEAFINKHLQDIDTAVVFLGYYPNCYQHLPEEVKLNQDFALELIKKDIEFYQNLPDTLKNEYEFIEKILVETHIDYKLFCGQLSKEIALQLLKNKLIIPSIINPEFFQDEAFFIDVIKNCNDYSQIYHMDLWHDNIRELINDNQTILKHLLSINYMYVDFASDELKNNTQFMLQAISINPLCMEYASGRLINDAEFLTAVHQLSDQYMLELMAKAALGLGLATIGLVLLTQVISLPIMLLAATTLATGLCMSGFFAHKIYANCQSNELNLVPSNAGI